jgi:hypothetical protein
MSTLARTAVSAAAVAVAAAMAPIVPAQAAGGGWDVVQVPSVQIDESFFMHRHVKGHPGNWHMLNVRIQQDDDGVLGGMTDFRCPRGEAPAPNGNDSCSVVGGAGFDDDSGLTVTYAKRLQHLRVHGHVDLVDNISGEVTPSRMNLRLYAGGRFTRTVTRTPPNSTDPHEYQRVDIRRGGRISARGHLGWLKATRAEVRNTEPLHVYWTKSRIPPTA